MVWVLGHTTPVFFHMGVLHVTGTQNHICPDDMKVEVKFFGEGKEGLTGVRRQEMCRQQLSNCPRAGSRHVGFSPSLPVSTWRAHVSLPFLVHFCALL